ncbi:MAG: cytochrome c-type biogenesis protein CycH [Porticoccaceae bacterium]|nr:MAG: cytochrome c-type biogenesis protein CycH [Porticoccaceae bacterium]
MTLWIALGLLASAAAACVLWPLLFGVEVGAEGGRLAALRALHQERRRQLREAVERGELAAAEAAELEAESERQLLAEAGSGGEGVVRTTSWGRRGLIATACAVPLLAAALYGALGAWREVEAARLLVQRAEWAARGAEDAPALARLDRRLQALLAELAAAHPRDPTYPLLLGKLAAERKDWRAAAEHYRRAAALAPQDGELLAEYAQLLFFAAGGRPTPEVAAAAERALSIAPDNRTALGLAGIAAFERGDYAAAARHWEAALAQLPADHPAAEALRAGVAAARERLGEAPAADGAGARLRVRVALADSLRVPPDSTVFVFARSPEAPGMPLAVVRLTAADLPAEVTLSDAMALAPGRDLSSARRVQVVARLSRSGRAERSEGDLEAVSPPLDVGGAEQPVELVIAPPLGS